LKADSVLQGLGKWIKLVGDKKLVSQTVIGTSNQRLMRKLCENCKQGYTPNTELLKKFNLPAEKAKCQGTGFVGRMGVFETIMLTDELRAAVRDVKQLPELGMQFRKAKMLYLQEQALRKTIAGTTAINEMVRVLAPAEKQENGAAQQ
jgi:type II secretory ATPase GspE/PulE/Tfp pilus assembly ATPase PilB-like protein